LQATTSAIFIVSPVVSLLWAYFGPIQKTSDSSSVEIY